MEISLKQRVFSVKQVNEYARALLSGDPLLGDVSVRGEVSNLKYHSSGHIYFSIKDSEALLRCAFFRQNAVRCSFRLEDGMQLVVRGYVTVYPRDGTYQLVVSAASMDGVGALYALFEKRKAELAARGLFDPAHKRQLPVFARRIAVITSPTGAVLRDIVRVSRRRFPGMGILLLPVAVQGDGAAGQIAAAIRTASALEDIEAVIVGRGGGSMEDLWAFNETDVAQAIYDCRYPVVSAVGHETDFTIADFVADARAATPSQAAEMLAPDAGRYLRDVILLRRRVQRAQRMQLDLLHERLTRVMASPVLQRPDAYLQVLRERITGLWKRLLVCFEAEMAARRARLSLMREKAEALGPKGVLRRGYAMVRQGERLVISAAALEPGAQVDIVMADGQRKARVLDEQGKA